MTPPPTEAATIPCSPPCVCVYMESRACAYTTVQTATDTADGVLTLYKGAKTRASQRAAQTLNRKRKHRLKRFTRRRRFSSHQRQHKHQQKRSLCSITIQKRKTVGKTQKKARIYEKKLANTQQTVYYVLASEREQRKQPLRERDGQKTDKKNTKSGGQKNVDIQKQKQRQNNST